MANKACGFCVSTKPPKPYTSLADGHAISSLEPLLTYLVRMMHLIKVVDSRSKFWHLITIKK